MGDSNYKPNSRGFQELMLSSGTSRVVVDAAERGKAYAESISPVKTGEYRGSFHVRASTAGQGLNKRAAAILENTSGHAFYVEYQDEFRVLQRTVGRIEGG